MYRDYLEEQYGLAGMSYTEQVFWLGHSLPPMLERREGSSRKRHQPEAPVVEYQPTVRKRHKEIQ